MVYRFITKGTCEQKMIEVASRKLGLDTVVLGGARKTNPSGNSEGMKNPNEMSVDELDSLLRYGAYHVVVKDDASAAASDTALMVIFFFVIFEDHDSSSSNLNSMFFTE